MLSRARRYLYLGAAILGIAGGVLAHYISPFSGLAEKPELSGLMSREFPTPSGENVRLADLPAPYTLLNLWAVWCAPCRAEMPLLSEIQESYSHDTLMVVGLAFDEMDKIKQFLTEVDVNFTILNAGLTGMSEVPNLSEQTVGLPTTLLLDQEGNILAKKTGAFATEQEAHEFIMEIL